MSVVLTILLWLLAIVGGFLLLLVMVPVHIRATGSISGWSVDGRAEGRWGWGFVAVRAARGQGVGLYLLGLRLYRFEADDDKKERRRQKNGIPVVGTRLIREWQGRRYEVTTVQGGFEHEGRRYRSLSAIARAITGTSWNGPAFFGLRKPEKKQER